MTLARGTRVRIKTTGAEGVIDRASTAYRVIADDGLQLAYRAFEESLEQLHPELAPCEVFEPLPEWEARRDGASPQYLATNGRFIIRRLPRRAAEILVAAFNAHLPEVNL